MAKENLVINCEICDARKIKEETYEGYKKIMINTELLITNERGREILNRLGAMINSEATVDAPDDEIIDSRINNGSEVITKDSIPANKMVLVVNGNLTIEAGAEAALDKYIYIVVNGNLSCPKNLKSYISRMVVNGSVKFYPEDAVELDEEFYMDKYFPLRIKQGEKYYVAKRLVIKEEVDADKLAEKEPFFDTPVAVIPESKVEKVATLFDIKTKLDVVPEGMKIIPGGSELNDALINIYGDSLYVAGDLKVDTEFANIEAVKKLIVTGTLKIKKSLYEKLPAGVVTAENVDFVFEGKTIVNVPRAKIDRTVLLENEKGVMVKNCALLKIDEDVESSLISERLIIKNCANVTCTEEQKSTVATVSKNVANIGPISLPSGDDSKEGGSGATGLFDSVFGIVKQVAQTSMINAEKHIM